MKLCELFFNFSCTLATSEFVCLSTGISCIWHCTPSGKSTSPFFYSANTCGAKYWPQCLSNALYTRVPNQASPVIKINIASDECWNFNLLSDTHVQHSTTRSNKTINPWLYPEEMPYTWICQIKAQNQLWLSSLRATKNVINATG